MREAIERSPRRSVRRHSVSLGLSEASVRRILHKDLHFYPYKIQVTHALYERDYVNRVNFSQTFLRLINPLSPELNPICYLLALLAHHFLHVSRIRIKSLTLR